VIERGDPELVAAAKGGSAAALAEMLRRHQGAVRSFLRRMCGNPDLADDLAQETFLAAFSRFDRFRGEASLRAWLCGIAWFKLRESRRGGWRRMRRERLAAQDADGMDDPRGRTERRLDIETAFRTLSIEQQAAAALCLASDWSHAEAATALGIPLGTLKSRVAAAKAILVKSLETYR